MDGAVQEIEVLDAFVRQGMADKQFDEESWNKDLKKTKE